MKELAQKLQIVEVENEGFNAFLGKTITLFCAVYIYTGEVIGVNSTFIKLKNPKIVYETGAFDEPKWKDAQALPNEIYVQTDMIEMFGEIK
jgi:hypothetical protein